MPRPQRRDSRHRQKSRSRERLGAEQDMKKAVEWYKKAAKQGNMWAQHNLGYCYEYGEGIRKNHKKAVEWFTKAAEQGSKKAKRMLKDFYK